MVDRRPSLVVWLAQLDGDRSMRLAWWTTLWIAFVVVCAKQRAFLLRSVAEERTVPGLATYRSEPKVTWVLAAADDEALRRRSRLAAMALSACTLGALVAHTSFVWTAWLSLLALLGAVTFVRHRADHAWSVALPAFALAALAKTSALGDPLTPLCAALGVAFLFGFWRARLASAVDPFGGYGTGAARLDRREARARTKRALALGLIGVGLTTMSGRSLDGTWLGHGSTRGDAGAPAARAGDVPELVDGGLLDARASR